MRRLAIFVHHDQKGAVRQYIPYCLKGLKAVVDDIVFVVNGSLSVEGRSILEQIDGVSILVRENRGFDFWGWKAGIEYYGYERIRQLDSLLLTNNTYYGPIYPFSEMWSIMDKVKCDFWGINRHRELDKNYIPGNNDTRFFNHIQSYWIVFRKSILQSIDFINYWKFLRLHTTYDEMLCYGEFQMTHYFEIHGYKSEVFMSTDKYSHLLYSNPCFMTDIQVIDDRCPIIKRKFFWGYKEHLIANRINYATLKLIDYLKCNKLYDIDIIFEDLLSTQHLSNVHNHLYYNYILSSDLSYEINRNTFDKKIALIMYIYPEELIEYCRKYAESIPQYATIIIVNTSSIISEKCQRIFNDLKNKIEYRIQPNRGRDNAALLVTCRDIIEEYDYICFVHAKKSEHNAAIYGQDFRDHCYISLLFNVTYVNNVISTLENNSRLGLLIPFVPVGFAYSGLIFDKWTCNMQNAQDFLNSKMNLNISLDPNVMAPFGGMYWAKTKALKTLLQYNWQYNDFPEEPLKQSDGLLTHTIERIIPLLVQYDGYFTAHIAPECYAKTIIGDLYYWLKWYVVDINIYIKIINLFKTACKKYKLYYTLAKLYKLLKA
ncbi:MAG: rhamnan synthesis F family protein [Prevotellaceae bacterium]|jgi:rhamnosyltransferase|nr:rhamnan synthesis F family protein [Prevotellaceae bacterium]